MIQFQILPGDSDLESLISGALWLDLIVIKILFMKILLIDVIRLEISMKRFMTIYQRYHIYSFSMRCGSMHSTLGNSNI